MLYEGRDLPDHCIHHNRSLCLDCVRYSQFQPAFIVSDSLAEKFSVTNSGETDKIKLPVLEVALDNEEIFNFKIVSWSKSTKEKFYEFTCESQTVNDIYSVGGNLNVVNLTISGIGTSFPLIVSSYEFSLLDLSKRMFNIKVY